MLSYSPQTVICTTCATENPADAKFCVRCGARMSCPTCGAPTVSGAHFCANCGTRLAADDATDAPASASTDGNRRVDASGQTTERRVVTVLFADLVGFTTLSATRDPETIRELQSEYFQRTREIVGRYGGIVEKFIGDAVMALWGAPTAFEDDAERAVRAALDLVEMVPLLGSELSIELQLRAGVLTGEAAVQVGAEAEGMVAGDMVNTAARLQSAATPGTVLVGEATVLAAGEAIAFESAGDQELKGKPAPVRSWRALRVVAERGGARRQEAIEPPFVGRADELRYLKEQFHATGREGRARLVSLVGQAGIGKSRLAWELEKYLDGVVEPVWWHRGRSPSYGEGVTFWALSEMFRRRAGLAEGDDPETTRRAVAEMLQQHVPDDAERAWMEPRMLMLLGVEEAPEGGSAELFAAWRTFFERMAATATVALVIEDLHWSDDGLLDFLEHLLDWSRSSPIFVLTLARPELLDRRASWGTDRRGASAIRLDPLPDPAMRELLEGVAPGLPGGVVTRILERADGIPLYAVETVRMLVARGHLVERDGRFTAAEGALELRDLQVPPTLRALVAARLDALSPADRSLLQDAAVLGQSFTVDALMAMSGASADALAPRLAGLVRREILTVERDPRAPTRGHHAFVQSVLREVAFATLAKRERRARHLTAARYFESLGDEEVAGVVATHFVEAYRAAPDGPEGEAVAAQARISLVATAGRAQELGALGQAIDALTTALDVTPDPAQRARLLERIGRLQTLHSDWDVGYTNLTGAVDAYTALGDRVGALRATGLLIGEYLSATHLAEADRLAASVAHEVETLVAEAVRKGPRANPEAAEVAAIVAEAMARTALRHERLAEAIRWSDRSLSVAAALHLDETIAMALVTKRTAMTDLGQLREGIALLEGAVADATAHRQHFAMLRGLNNLASITVVLDPRASLEQIRLGMATARRLGLRTTDAYNAGNAATAAEPLGEWTWLREAVSAMLEGDRDADERHLLETVRDFPGVWTGTFDVADGQRLVARARAQGDPQLERGSAGYLSRSAFAAGNPERAFEVAEPYFQPATIVGKFEFEHLARFALHAGKVDAVRRISEEMGSGLGGVTEHHLETIRAGIAALEGRRDDAVSLYRSALAGYRAFGVRFTFALAVLDMAKLLGPEDPAVRSVVQEGRAVLVDLGADPLVAQLDTLTGGSRSGDRRSTSTPAAMATQG